MPRINRSATGRWTRFLPAIAGIGYGVAWVAGLVVWPSNLAIDASEDGIVSLYATHMSQATAQYRLVEGLAGICLGTVLLYCVRRAGRGDRRWTPIAALLGGVAVRIFPFAMSTGIVPCLLSEKRSPESERRTLYRDKSSGWRERTLVWCDGGVAGHPSSRGAHVPTLAPEDKRPSWHRSGSLWTGLSLSMERVSRQHFDFASPPRSMVGRNWPLADQTRAEHLVLGPRP